VTSRRICWPDPDAVCLQGGCSYCNEGDFQTLRTIYRYARDHDMLRDYNIGWDNYWYGRVEVRQR
jgi:hypothetical protein